MSAATVAEPPLEDPTALARFGQIEVVARLVVEGYMVGQHKSPFKGTSVEFVEHRQYYPGDEIRHIDWRAYGKTGKYFIKEYEEETNLRAYMLVDASGSMNYGQSTLTKFNYGRTLAAALSYLLLQQRDAVGMIAFDTAVRERVEPSTSPHTFGVIANHLQKLQPGQETSLGGVITEIVRTLKRRSMVCILSDFFDSIEHVTRAIEQLRHERHEVILMQLLAPEEIDFPFTRPTQFRSLELANHRLLVDPYRLRSIYLEQFQQFRKDLRKVCDNARVDLVTFTTNQPYHQALGTYLALRSQRKQKS
jgi:uncharacterized protein (DUF58 family)